MHTIWKGWIGESNLKNEIATRQAKEVQSLKETTRNLALGEILLGIGEVTGFALTAASLADHGTRLTRAEAILQAYNTKNPIGFVCPRCLQPLSRLVDSYCGHCGDKIDWTDALRKNEPGTQPCPFCFYPVKLSQNYCSQCGKQLKIPTSTSTGLQFVPVRSWGLP